MNLWKSLRGLPKAVWVLSGALLVNRAGSGDSSRREQNEDLVRAEPAPDRA